MQSQFKVGSWAVDPESGLIQSSQKSVQLEPKVAELLVYLARHPDEVLSKERLIPAVWSDAFVADDVLTSAIWKLRQALGDDPKNPEYIQTIPRRGYKLIAPVTSQPTPGAEPPGLSIRFRRMGWVLTAATLLAVFGWYIFRDPPPSAMPGQVSSIAVLQLENLSPDPENEYFAVGFTDDISSALSKIGELRVVARTSAMRYEGSEKSLEEIAHELGVATLLGGSVRKAGNRVRINVQLIDAETRENLWAETYDRDLADVFEVQSEVSQQIAAALKVALSPAEKVQIERRPTENSKAYNLYLMGRYQRSIETTESLKRAVDYYRQAIKEDPDFAEAHAGLANVYQHLNWRLGGEWTMEKVEAAVRKALELDNSSPYVIATLGVLQAGYGDLENAESSFKKALELEPDNDYYHREYGIFLLRSMERLEEARIELNRAVELDPVSFDNWYFLLEFYRTTGELDKALQAARKLWELAPNWEGGHVSRVYVALAEYEKAELWANKALEAGGKDGALVLPCLLQGKMDQATEISERQLLLNQHPRWAAVSRARAGLVALWAGDDDKARTFLEKAAQLHPNVSFGWPTARWDSTALGYILWKGGNRVEAEEMLSESLRRSESGRLGLYDTAMVHAIRGDKEAAYKWLRRAIDSGWLSYSVAARDPIWAEFHEEPRFQEMMAEVESKVDVMRQRVRAMEQEWESPHE